MLNKNLYRCTSAVQALNYCRRIFFKSLSYLYEVVRTNFSSDFWIFAIFDRSFAKIVAPPSNECEKYVAYLKEQSIPKKRCKLCRNQPINGNAMLVRTTHGAPDSKQKTNKHHIFAPTAGARCTIFPKHCMVIELVVPILKGVIHFWI